MAVTITAEPYCSTGGVLFFLVLLKIKYDINVVCQRLKTYLLYEVCVDGLITIFI